jgi:hypothetical protein
MSNISSITKILILGGSSALIYYVYSPSGMNFIRITKYIKTMKKQGVSPPLPTNTI